MMRAPSTLRESHAETSPYESLPRRAVLLTMAGVLLGLLLAALDMMVVGTAMPRVVADLGGFEHYTWVVTAYMVASTVTLPLAGKLSDLHGRKPYYLVGTVIFLAGSILCGASQSMTWLVFARAFQGLGAGVMQAITFAVIGDLFPPAQRGKVQGLTGSVFGLAAVVGPALGGYITDNLSWRWVFYVNLPVGLLALAVLVAFFPNLRPNRKHGGIDFLGAGTLVLCAVPLLLALSWGGISYPWSSPIVVGLLGLALVMGVAFVLAERRAAEPILPPSLFTHRVVANAWLAVFLTAVGMFGTILFVPVFVQAVLGGSATTSGAALAPMMVSFVLSSAVAGLLITRTGRYKVFAVVGLGMLVLGLGLLSQMGPQTDLGTLIRNIVLVGIAMGIGMPTFTIAVQNAVPYQILGTATASTQFARTIGGTLGTALMGTLVANRFGEAFRAGLPAELAAKVPPALLAQMENPQVLFTAERGSGDGLAAALGPQSQALAVQLVEVVRFALASALHDAFLVSALLVSVSFVASWFLPELPLRRRRSAES